MVGLKKYFFIMLLGASLSARFAGAQPPTYSEPSWQGVYVGAQMGGGFGTGYRNFSDGYSTGTFSDNGVIGGGTLGYNLQYGPYVVGLETDISASGISGDASCPNRAFECKIENDWFGTVRPRIGYVFDGALSYLTGGLAYGDIHSHSNNYQTGATGSDFTDTKVGYTAGVGVEVPFFLDKFTFKAEYLYMRFNDAKGLGELDTGPYVGSSATLQENIVRAGINYHF